MKSFSFILFIGIGFVQMAAINDGFRESFGNIIGTIFSVILGQMPIIGTIMGIMGAVNTWDWPWWGAALLFCSPLAIAILCVVIDKD